MLSTTWSSHSPPGVEGIPQQQQQRDRHGHRRCGPDQRDHRDRQRRERGADERDLVRSQPELERCCGEDPADLAVHKPGVGRRPLGRGLLCPGQPSNGFGEAWLRGLGAAHLRRPSCEWWCRRGRRSKKADGRSSAGQVHQPQARRSRPARSPGPGSAFGHCRSSKEVLDPRMRGALRTPVPPVNCSKNNSA